MAPLLRSDAFARSSRNLSKSERHSNGYVCVYVCERMTTQEVHDNYETVPLHDSGGDETYLCWTLPHLLMTALPVYPHRGNTSCFIRHHITFNVTAQILYMYMFSHHIAR